MRPIYLSPRTRGNCGNSNPSKSLTPTTTTSFTPISTETMFPSATKTHTLTSTFAPQATSTDPLSPWGHEIIPIHTPGPTPTALFLQGAEAACNKPEGLLDDISVTFHPFCFFWFHSFEDEKGFELVLEYSEIGKVYEIFIFQTSANVTSLLIPENYASRLDESREQCLKRKSFVLKLYVLQGNEKKYVTEMAQESECNLPNLPTATSEQ